MAAPEPGAERRALRVSIGASALLSVIGVAWGVVSGSQMILLDGIYALVGLAVSWLLLRAADVSAREPTQRHPYGFEAVTPMVIGVQGVVLLITLAYAASEAVFTIRGGGSDIVAGWAIAYSVLTACGALLTWSWLRRRVGVSDLLVSEALTWRVSALTSVGMIVGFAVMAVLQASSWDGAAPYVDPVMVLVTCVAFLPAPLRLLRTTVVELLESRPDRHIEAPVRRTVDDLTRRFGVGEAELRVAKLGPKLYVEVDGVVDGNVTIAEQQRIRDELFAELDRLPYEIWLNLELVPRGLDQPTSG